MFLGPPSSRVFEWPCGQDDSTARRELDNGMKNVLLRASLNVGGVASSNVALSDRSQHKP